MPVNVLLADHDLDIHKLVADILPLVFKNVHMDRVVESKAVIEKLGKPGRTYNLIILDLTLGDVDGQNVLSVIAEKFPQLLTRTVLIVDAPDTIPDESRFKSIPYVVKPFSLDAFSDILKKTRVETKR